ncbi:hypothetical protein SALSENF001_19890 [Salmonella enterica subsp. enterica serovar Senftenberg]|nr:hypothetical protein SL180013_21370 [Salmonella enterica subsp. enterica serovar Senftenberg]
MRCFSFRFSRASLLGSGAKVKKETENSSVHACVTLCGKTEHPLLKRVTGQLSTH